MNAINNEKQKEEAYMGFTLSEELRETILRILNAGDWDMEGAKEIPNAGGMVLVKEGTNAFFKRKTEPGNYMVPLKVAGKLDGVSTETLFFVCTR